MVILLTYFHRIRGPSILCKIPEDEEVSEQDKEVSRLLDFAGNKKFFIHSFDNFKTANYYFEVPSEWARGKKEMALISITYSEDNIDGEIFRIPLAEFVIELLSKKDIFKGFYVHISGHGDVDEINEKNAEIKDLLQNFSKVLPKSIITKKKSLKLFVFGLDRAGKTSILERLRRNEFVKTNRTLNLNLLNFILDNVNLVAWDLGGQIGFRRSWRNYLKEPNVLVFVIDIHDKDRYVEAKKELFRILDYPESSGIPLLILANKKDLGTSISKKNVIKELELNKIKDREWNMYLTSAVTGEGIYNGMHWIFKKLIT
ncbi:MAG: ADP-ribosylation factor family protein [Candidatus Helarchaeota archaeon]